jgi:adenylate kinase family enzyme
LNFIYSLGWLLDGMPRTAVQASALDEMGCRPNLVIALDVPGVLNTFIS